jgi:hypothetical protein
MLARARWSALLIAGALGRRAGLDRWFDVLGQHAPAARAQHVEARVRHDPYIQARELARGSYDARFCQALTRASCRASSETFHE